MLPCMMLDDLEPYDDVQEQVLERLRRERWTESELDALAEMIGALLLAEDSD